MTGTGAQDFYNGAMKAINQEQWDKATALAVTGLLGALIGALETFALDGAGDVLHSATHRQQSQSEIGNQQ